MRPAPRLGPGAPKRSGCLVMLLLSDGSHSDSTSLRPSASGWASHRRGASTSGYWTERRTKNFGPLRGMTENESEVFGEECAALGIQCSIHPGAAVDGIQPGKQRLINPPDIVVIVRAGIARDQRSSPHDSATRVDCK